MAGEEYVGNQFLSKLITKQLDKTNIDNAVVKKRVLLGFFLKKDI